MGDEIRLQSNGLVNTPGFIPYVASMWRTQPSLAIDLLAAYEDLPTWAIPQLLNGSYEKDGDTIVIKKDRDSKTPLCDLEQVRPGTRRRAR